GRGGTGPGGGGGGGGPARGQSPARLRSGRLPPEGGGVMTAGSDVADRRQAAAADELVLEVDEAIGGVAEQAAGLDLGEDDPLVLHVDGEVVTLVDAEPLAELTGKDHASELVDLAGHSRRARLFHMLRRRDGPWRSSPLP